MSEENRQVPDGPDQADPSCKMPFPLTAKAGRRRALAGIAAMAVAVAMIPLSNAIYPPFQRALEAMPLTEFFSTARQITGLTFLGSLTALVCLMDSKRRCALIYLFVALLLAGACTQILKTVTGRLRPEVAFNLSRRAFQEMGVYVRENPGTPVRAEIGDQWLFLKKGRPYAKDWFASFPSGHAGASFVIAGFLVVMYPRGRVVWLILAFGCAIARARFRRHFHDDVIFGAGMGTAITAWVFRMKWPAELAAWLGRKRSELTRR